MSPSPNKEIFRQIWGNFPSGVSVITFYEEEGTIHGLTANAVCSVSLEPFLVLVCIDHKARSFPLLSKSERFGMNLLSESQQAPCMHFAKSDTEGDPPFRFRKSPSGFPVLDGCVAYLDCTIVAKHLAGDHTIFVAEVEDLEFTGGDPLVFYNGQFVNLGGRP
ncbi:flavin reductase family protein [Dehalococcoidia bacterium]|nr:flavin reductase family protein [Dehalococcoidia bacterium]